MSPARRLGSGTARRGTALYPAGRLGDYIEELLPLPFSSWTNILIGTLFRVLVMSVRVAPVSGQRAARTRARCLQHSHLHARGVASRSSTMDR